MGKGTSFLYFFVTVASVISEVIGFFSTYYALRKFKTFLIIGFGVLSPIIGSLIWNNLCRKNNWPFYMGGEGNEPFGIYAFVWGTLTILPVIFCARIVTSAHTINNRQKVFEWFISQDFLLIILFTLFAGIAAVLFYGPGNLIFNWDEIPEEDTENLKNFLNKNYDIGWINVAQIEKVDDDKTIEISAENNLLWLRLNDEKTKVNLEINDGRTDEFFVIEENSNLNIYEKDHGIRLLISQNISEKDVKELIIIVVWASMITLITTIPLILLRNKNNPLYPYFLPSFFSVILCLPILAIYFSTYDRIDTTEQLRGVGAGFIVRLGIYWGLLLALDNKYLKPIIEFCQRNWLWKEF